MNKVEEIKLALSAATPGPWSLEEGWADSPMMVMRPGGNIPIAELAFENYENDGKLIAKAPEYIAYLLEYNERLSNGLERASQSHRHMEEELIKAERTISIVRGLVNQPIGVFGEGFGWDFHYKNLRKNLQKVVGQEGEGNQ